MTNNYMTPDALLQQWMSSQFGPSASIIGAQIGAGASMYGTNISAQLEAARIQSAERSLQSQQQMQQYIAQLQQQTTREDIQARLKMASDQLGGDIWKTQATLAEQQQEFKAKYGLDVANFNLQKNMYEANEFANPSDWVKQSYYLRNQAAPQGGPLRTDPVNLQYTPAQLPAAPQQSASNGSFSFGVGNIPAPVAPSPFQPQRPNIQIPTMATGSNGLSGSAQAAQNYNNNLFTQQQSMQGGGRVTTSSPMAPNTPLTPYSSTGGQTGWAKDASGNWVNYSTVGGVGGIEIQGAARGYRNNASLGNNDLNAIFSRAAKRANYVPGPATTKQPPNYKVDINPPDFNDMLMKAQNDNADAPNYGQPPASGITAPPVAPANPNPSDAPDAPPPPPGAVPAGQGRVFVPDAGQATSGEFYRYDAERGGWVEDGRSEDPATQTPDGQAQANGAQNNFAPPIPSMAGQGGISGPNTTPPSPQSQNVQWRWDATTRTYTPVLDGTGIPSGLGGPSAPYPQSAGNPPGNTGPLPVKPAPTTPQQQWGNAAGTWPALNMNVPNLLPPWMQTMLGQSAGSFGVGMQGAADGMNMANKPLVVGEHGPEVVHLPAGSQVVPLNNAPGGTTPMYNVQPANQRAAGLIGSNIQIPERFSFMQGAADGFGSLDNYGNMFGANYSGGVSTGVGIGGNSGSNGQQQQPMYSYGNGNHLLTNSGTSSYNPGSSTGYGNPYSNPLATTGLGAGPSTGGSFAPSAGANGYGYNDAALSNQPWMKALSTPGSNSQFGAYGGPLGLPGYGSDVPAPHQIALQSWMNMTPTERQMAGGYYRALGISNDDLNEILRRQMPGTLSQTANSSPTWRL